MPKKITVIGGGTGTYTILSGLKNYPVDLSVIVTTTDSGGSNRIIRDEFGLLPTSDIRQCILALASNESSEVLRQLFTYRYVNGIGISGMTFGNLFMAALADIYGSQEKAIEKTCEMLDVRGNIIPVTLENTNLVARYDNGKQVLGEHYIDEPNWINEDTHIVELSVFPPASANKKAIQTIKSSDMIILGPGDLYTSILCNFVVEGIPQAIKKSKAKKVFVMNLMTRFGQTHGFSAYDHLREIEHYIGKGTIDYILINTTDKIPKEILKRYEIERASPVKDDLQGIEGIKVIKTDLISNIVHTKAKTDNLQRSLIRHDPEKLAKEIMKLVDNR
jgi:uncharacterized cofD-like protein